MIGSYDHYNYEQIQDGSLNPMILTNPAGFLAAVPPLTAAYSYSTADGSQYSQRSQIDKTAEVRFTSPSEDRFRWQVGGYYSHSMNYAYADSRTDLGQGVVTQRFISFPSNPLKSISVSDKNQAQDYAVFGQAAYDIWGGLTAEASLRWDEEDKYDINLIPPAFVADPVRAPSGLVRTNSFYALQPKFTLRYKANDNVTAYASYGRGFRSGGFSPAGTGFRVSLQAPGTNFPDAYPSEKADAYELGLKTQWLNHRLIINAAVFYTDIKDAQAFTAFPNPPITFVISLPGVRAQGVEFDIAYRLTDELRVSGKLRPDRHEHREERTGGHDRQEDPRHAEIPECGCGRL